MYKEYTAEEAHIIFTDQIKRLSDRIIGNETNPYLKVKKIFDFISDNYPWAGAREYSTIPNIPEYVIENTIMETVGKYPYFLLRLLVIMVFRQNGKVDL